MPVTMIIPYDVWEHISRFIRPSELRELYGVNKALLYIVLNCRYREVLLSGFNDKKMRYLEHLRCQSRLGSLVRSVHIDTWAVFSPSYSRGHTIGSSEEILSAIVATLPAMTRVQTFHIHWRNHYLFHDLIPFFSLAWKTFGNNLTRLDILAPLPHIKTILSTAVGFTSLEEVILVFRIGNFFATTSDFAVQTNVLAPFVNSISKTLRKLSLCSTPPIDFSPFVQSLVFLPKLEVIHFELRVTTHVMSTFVRQYQDTLIDFAWSPGVHRAEEKQWEAGMLSNCIRRLGLHVLEDTLPSIVTYISTLQSLTHLRLQGLPLDSQKLQRLVDGLVCDNLRSVSLYVNAISCGVLDLLSSDCFKSVSELRLQHRKLSFSYPEDPSKQIVRRCLSRLDIRGIHMALPEMTILLSFLLTYFDPGGGGVAIDIRDLNASTFDYLAANLSQVRSLRLHVVDLGMQLWDENDPYNNTSPMDEFACEMAGRRYVDWRLEELRLTVDGEEGVVDRTELVEVMVNAIPSLLVA